MQTEMYTQKSHTNKEKLAINGIYAFYLCVCLHFWIVRRQLYFLYKLIVTLDHL